MESSPPPTFGDLLRRHREAATLSQEALAEQAGLSARGISDLERGLRSQPRLETVRLLADALPLDPADRAALLAAARSSAAPAPVAHLALRTTLPAAPTPLLGRQDEVARLRTLLVQPDIRLVTITGPGGVGKTRLAIEAAAALRDAFPDGVGFVDLAPVRDPALVLATIAAALGLTEQGDRSLLATLQHALAERALLLVLDNCEHVLAAAPEIAQLLAAAPELTILATSRARLDVRAEQDVRLAPLPVAEADRLPPLSDLAALPSIALFVARARALQPDFALTDANAAAIAGICAQADGLPLAIELAAPQLKLLSPAALLQRLERRLPLLTGGARDAPDRQRTLRDTITWSVDLLAPSEQALFRRLGVFVGGWTLETAEAVANHDGDLDVFRGLAILVDASLVQRIDRPEGQVRFGMLETIREFALERLTTSGEEAIIRDAHAAQFRPLAEWHFQAFWGPEQRALSHQLEAEYPNLRAALSWLMATGRADDALALAGALSYFGYAQGHFAESQRWLEQALAASNAGGIARVRALLGAGAIRWSQGDYATAQTQLEEGVQLARAASATDLEAWGISMLGTVAEFRGDDPTAIRFYEQALALARAANLPPMIGHALINLGDARYREGDLAQAEMLVRESLAIFADLQVYFDRSIALSTLGYIMLARGDLRAALEAFDASLALAQAVHDQWTIANNLAAYGAAAAAVGQHEHAARLLGASETARDVAGHRRLANHFQQAETLAKVRAALDEPTFTHAWAEGRAMSTEEAIAEAAATMAAIANTPQTETPGVSTDRHGLTPREREVLRLVVAGQTDQQIADALFVSRRTVTTHVANVLGKLDAANRAEAAAAAVRLGLD